MNLIGHEKQKRLLKMMAQSGRVPHNLLFTGPESIGKRKAAKEFIKVLNCKVDGKDDCAVCREIRNDRYSDLITIQEDSEINIDKVREIQKRMALTGRNKDSYKGAIIDKAHLMNKQAQACLLKTLEEPKGKAIIILITEHPNILLKTILSRMWTMRFSSVESEPIREKLISMGAKKRDAEKIVRVSSSKPGLAIRILENEKFRTKRMKKENDLKKIKNSRFSKRFEYVKEIAEDKKEARETLKVWLSSLREDMINAEDVAEAQSLGKTLSRIQKSLLLTSKTNANLKLLLEEIVINL